MSVPSTKRGVGLLLAFLSVAQLIAVVIRVKHTVFVLSDLVGWYGAGILAAGLSAVAILTPPLVPIEEERYTNWYVALLMLFLDLFYQLPFGLQFPFCLSNFTI